MENILFLHGALGTRSQFAPIIQLLESTYQCHAINFAGHGGRLIPPSGLTFDVFAGDILNYLYEKKIEKINLVGYSMGGYAALYFAYKYPNRVKSIVTINVKFNWDPTSTAREIAMLNADKMMDKIPAFANNLMLWHGMNMWKSLLKGTGEMMQKLSETVLLSKAELASIKHKIMLIVGDRDKTSSITETHDIYKLLPNASFMVLPNTPHPLEQINTNLLTTAIKTFLV
jgi:pimeloyl-ACP methyl ester carboxylesterase